MNAGLYRRYGKRCLDLVCAIALLLVLSPLLAVTALLVWLDAGRPIIYRRRVIGYAGMAFDALKFRTMVVNPDEVLRARPGLLIEYRRNVKLRHDPRVTRVGRTLRRSSLDELPQLINVVKGQMSLVGPRIISPEECERYGELILKRCTVRPGLTGLWQVSGRSDVDYGRRIQLDTYYVEHVSIWLDLWILARTLPAVLSTQGAF